MSELQEEKVLIKTIVCPAKVSDFNPKLGATTLDHKASIAAAKGAVTKLTKNLNGYVPFYIVSDFFKNPATNKPIAPVFVMGKEKKLAKHFVSVEMKSGKADQRSSATQKDAATGRIYAEQTEAGLMLCFEPHPKCKVPAPKWEKLFKALKPCLKGLSCKVVEPSAAALAEAAAEEAGTAATTTAAAGPAPAAAAAPTFNVAELKTLITTISTGIKGLPTTVIPKIKAGTATDADRTLVADLLANLESFETMYASAPANVKTQLQKTYTTLVGQKPKLQAIISKIDQTLATQPAQDTAGADDMDMGSLFADDPDLAALLADAEALAQEAEQTKQAVEQDLANSEPLPAGQEMLDSLYA